MANLTGSWLAFRLGVDPVRIERMRKEGELYAVRNDPGEWEYPGWQFDAAGQTKPAVKEMLQAARAERRSPRELLERKMGSSAARRTKDPASEGCGVIRRTPSTSVNGPRLSDVSIA